MFHGVNNVYGMVGKSDSVHFLGVFSTVEECAAAARGGVGGGAAAAGGDASAGGGETSGGTEAAVASETGGGGEAAGGEEAAGGGEAAGSGAMSSFAFHSATFPEEKWRGTCFGRRDAGWDPKRQPGVDSGRIRTCSPQENGNSRTEEEQHSGEGEAARARGPWGDALECNVLEWRLLKIYKLGPDDRFILSMRSCSLCGWRGCTHCPPLQICPAVPGVPGAEKPIKVRYSGDHLDASWAHVIMFPATGDFSQFTLPQKREPHQEWIAIAGESSHWWPHVETLTDDKRFATVMGYARHYSDMHAAYMPSNFSELQVPRSWSLEETEDFKPEADAVLFVSNCHSESRTEWLKGLMEAMKVDSFGACLNTRTLPVGLRRRETQGDVDQVFERGGAWGTAQAGQSDVKMLVTSHYTFGLAVENTREPDYITEKLYEVLAAGAIPVYLGAPNWREFFPVENAVIDAGEFDGPHDLAEYLTALAKDPARLATFHEWRKVALPPAVHALENVSFTHNLCRACRWKAARSGLPTVTRG